MMSTCAEMMNHPVYIVIKLIVHYNHQCQLLARALQIKGFFNPFDVKPTCAYFNSGNFKDGK